MRAPIASGTAARSRVILACIAYLASAILAPPVLAQARQVSSAEADARLAARLDPETGRQIAALLDSARQAQLPVEPLVDKALEGASKRAPGPRIVEAVRRLSADLAESRRLLGPQATPAEVTAGAHALRARIAPAALRRLHEKRGRTTLVTSLGVYQELVALRVSEDTAAAAVVALHEAGVTAQQLAEFQHEVARDIAVGGSPAMVVAVATELRAGDGILGPTTESFQADAPRSTGGTSPRTKRRP